MCSILKNMYDPMSDEKPLYGMEVDVGYSTCIT